MSLEWDVQKTIYERLIADTALVNAVTLIADEIPQDTAMPYIKIGEVNVSEWDDSCSLGGEASITIHVFSKKEGKKEAQTINGMIKDLLAYQANTLAESYIVGIIYESSRSFLDPDGETRHGVSTYRVLIKAS